MKHNLVSLATLSCSLVLVGASCSTSTSPTVTEPVNPEPVATTTTTVEPAPEPTPTPTPTTKPSPTPATTNAKATYYGVSGVDKVGSVTTGYLATAKVYKESGYYYQFVSCHGNPGLLRMKAGSKFMLDNRDKTEHKVVLGNTTYVLPGYGYIIASAPYVYGTQHLVCDGGGAALINVEK